MIRHHPNTNLLSEYAAGSLGLAQSIAVSSHLHFCHQCRQQVEAFEALGGAVFGQLKDGQMAEVSDAVFEATLSRIQGSGDQDTQSEQASEHRHGDDQTDTVEPNKTSFPDLPPLVGKLIGRKSALNWKKLSQSLQIAPLKTGQNLCEVSLHKISAGGRVMAHDHKGMEYTLVLKGSFSDEDGMYQPGDFLLRKPGEEHSPYAAANRDCICLTVVEAPVKFTGLFSRLLNPFLRVQPQ